MRIKNFFSIMIIGLLSLSPVMFIADTHAIDNETIISNQFSTQATDVFVEDFVSTTYRDNAETTAVGWMHGTVTKARDYEVTFQDFYATPDPIYSVKVDGRKAYASCYNDTTGADTIYGFNLLNPADIKLMSARDSWVQMYCLETFGDVLYTGAYYTPSEDVFTTYDISNPYNLLGSVVMDWVPIDADIRDIEVYGQHAFVGCYGSWNNKALRVIDAKDPNDLKLITPNWDVTDIYGIEVEGQLAYVAACYEGLFILNVSSKYNMIEYAHLDTPGLASDVIIDGDIAYVADGFAGVQVIDVSDPTAPVIIGSRETNGFARKLKLQGNTLYVADEHGGLVVLDVADPTNPTWVLYISFTGNVYDVDTLGNCLVIGTEIGLYTFVAGSPGGGIKDLTHQAYPNAWDQLEVWDVRVRGDVAYIAGGPDGFYTLDVSNPYNPTLLDHYPILPGETMRKLDVDGGIAHVIRNNAQDMFDVKDPSNIILKSSITGANMIDVFIQGDMTYVTAGTILGVANCSNLDSPTLTDILPGFTNLTALWSHGSNLYAVEYYAGSGTSFHTINVSDPTNIGVLYSRSRTPLMYDIYVDNDLAYLGAGDWMAEYNVSNPLSYTYPDFISGIHNGTWAFGPYVLSAMGQNGVSLIDCTNPNAIATDSTYSDATSAIQITTHGDYTYVANKSSLVILRHYESIGDTYIDSLHFAQSLEIDNTDNEILSVILTVDDFVPFDTSVTYYISANGGLNWEYVIPGVQHNIVHSGNNLIFRIAMFGTEDRSPHIYELTIEYSYNIAPLAPLLHDPGTTTHAQSINLTWDASIDDFSNIDKYQIHRALDAAFTSIIGYYNTSDEFFELELISEGTYYYRVRAFDNYGLYSAWSNVVDITYELALPPPSSFPWWAYLIIGGGVVVIAAIVLTVILLKKRATPTR
ncbi:MAG: hypothetical protein ACTSO7_07845 [Candidatus Heimdallarchaeota archaeon]